MRETHPCELVSVRIYFRLQVASRPDHRTSRSDRRIIWRATPTVRAPTALAVETRSSPPTKRSTFSIFLPNSRIDSPSAKSSELSESRNRVSTGCYSRWFSTDGLVPIPGGTCGIGLRALGIGIAFLDRDPIVQATAALLAHMCRQFDETMHLARLDGKEVVYPASRESAPHLRENTRVGHRFTCARHCTRPA